MAKTISFTYEGQDYILEFTRASIVKMEQSGFIHDDIYEKPMSAIPQLFAGAFIAHHPSVSKNTIDAIYDNIGNRRELLKTLSDMYLEPIETLMEDNKGEGKLEWKMA